MLIAMGVDEALVEAFRANKSFNLTSRTAVVQALLAMEDAEGRPAMVALMAAAQNIPEAEFQVASLNLLSAYHVLEHPLSRVVSEAGFPVAVTADNRLVAALAVEYVPWTAGIAATLDWIMELAPARDAASRELWLGGQASPRSRREMESRGWTVHESSFEKLKN